MNYHFLSLHFFRFTLSIKWLFSIIIIFFAGNCLAQSENFLTEVDPLTIVRNQELNDFEEKWGRHNSLISSKYIKLGKLSKAVEKNGNLSLVIPGKELTIKATPKSVKYYTEQNYEWIGNTDGGQGTAIILSREGQVSAHITTPAGVYEIHPAPNGLHVFQEIANAGNVGCLEPPSPNVGIQKNEERVSQKLEGKQTGGSHNARMEGCSPITNPRVLCLYTQNALNAIGGISQITNQINLSVAQFNSAIQNSAISFFAQLNLAGIAQLTGFNETNFMGSDLNSLISNTTAQNLRDQYQADLVVLFTDGPYDEGTRGAAGTINVASESAYAVVQLWASTSYKTFAHEVGHLFGCRHNDHSGTPSYAQAYRIHNKFLGQDDWTLMADGSEAEGRHLNFSNPTVYLDGRVTGTSDCNNARRITETYTAVSNFRSNPYPPLTMYLTGPTSVSTTARQDYEMVYGCGDAPYTYLWEKSTDGVNYTFAGQGGDTYFWYFNTAGYYFLRGTVTANGQTATDFLIIELPLGKIPMRGWAWITARPVSQWKQLPEHILIQ